MIGNRRCGSKHATTGVSALTSEPRRRAGPVNDGNSASIDATAPTFAIGSTTVAETALNALWIRAAFRRMARSAPGRNEV